MKDLQNQGGVKVMLGDDNKLVLDSSLSGGDFSKRSLNDILDVLMQKDLKLEDKDLYYMYRDIHYPEIETKIRENTVRFDMTVILPGMLGKEYNKTLGHYHPDKQGQTISYPEVYEVVSGRAFYLVQKPKRTDWGIDYPVIESAYLVEVRAGEKAIMPPDYGHITINIDQEPLVMANWVSSQFSSDYAEIKNLGGGAVYLVEENNQMKIEKNKQYLEVPEVKVVRPKELPQFALLFNKPMYQTGSEDFAKLDYLSNPERYKNELTPEKLFELK